MNKPLIWIMILVGLVAVILTQQSTISDPVQNKTPPTPLEENNLPEESCVTLLTPISWSTVSFPLEVSISLEYGCWTIFEAQAGVAVISQNGNNISPIDINNGLMAVQDEYMDINNYPVTATAMITTLNGVFSGAAEIIITPENPCGTGPECPPSPDPLIIPIILP
jgi:hypothetical protein